MFVAKLHGSVFYRLVPPVARFHKTRKLAVYRSGSGQKSVSITILCGLSPTAKNDHSRGRRGVYREQTASDTRQAKAVRAVWREAFRSYLSVLRCGRPALQARGRRRTSASSHQTTAGGPGDDTINGSRGDDNIFGSAGSDWLYGSAGDDYIQTNGDGSVDRVFCGDGFDRVTAGVEDVVEGKTISGNIEKWDPNSGRYAACEKVVVR